MQFEDEMLWEELRVAPDDPTDSSVNQPKFVAGGIDRFDSWKLKIPIRADRSVWDWRVLMDVFTICVHHPLARA